MTLIGAMLDWLSQLVTIERGTEGVAESGQSQKYFSVIAADVQAQIQVRSGQFLRADFGDNPAALATIFLEPETDIAVGDRVLDGTNVWMVDAVNAPRMAEVDHLEVTVHLVTGGTP